MSAIAWLLEMLALAAIGASVRGLPRGASLEDVVVHDDGSVSVTWTEV